MRNEKVSLAMCILAYKWQESRCFRLRLACTMLGDLELSVFTAARCMPAQTAVSSTPAVCAVSSPESATEPVLT